MEFILLPSGIFYKISPSLSFIQQSLSLDSQFTVVSEPQIFKQLLIVIIFYSQSFGLKIYLSLRPLAYKPAYNILGYREQTYYTIEILRDSYNQNNPIPCFLSLILLPPSIFYKISPSLRLISQSLTLDPQFKGRL